MSADEPTVELTLDSRPKLPNGTAIATYEDDVVVSGVGGTKTLSGQTAPVALQILEASDGQTPLRTLSSTIGDEATTLAVAERLCADGLLYPTERLAAFDVEQSQRSLLESLLLSVDPGERDGFARRVKELSVAVRGASELVEVVREPLADLGCSFDTDTPDVVLFGETNGSEDRTAVNREWLATDATLVRLWTGGSSIEIGPVLTPSSTACLSCLTTRKELNSAGETLSYRTVVREPTYETQWLSHLGTALTLRAGLNLVPAGVVGRLHRFDVASFEHEQARLLGVPGCEVCGTEY